MLLVLAALKHREQLRAADRLNVPVPVLFTAQNWDPRRQPVRDWLTGRLQETYPLFTGTTGAANASALIAAGKIALILDGLDEIAPPLRPAALQALGQQASFRVVVLSRTTEMASASQRGLLHGAAAIELRPIDPAEAAAYLERVQLDPPPEGWRDLTERIRSNPASPLSSALDSPLTLTLVRDTYQAGDDARELLNFCDTTLHDTPGDQATEKITGHLLDRVLPAAYARCPGQPPPRYDLQIARNALSRIAVRMNQEGTRDLQWWRIPRWAPCRQRLIAAGLAAGLVAGLAFGLVAGLAFGLSGGLVLGLVAGLAFGLSGGLVYGVVFGLVVGFPSLGGLGPPRRIGKLRLQQARYREALVFALMCAPEGGLLGGLAGHLVLGLAIGLLGGLVLGLIFVLMDALTDLDNTGSPSPALSWLDDRRYGYLAGLVFGLMFGLLFGLLFGRLAGLGGLVYGLLFGLLFGLLAGLLYSKAWTTSLVAAQFARRWHTPANLMNFLDDARERNILRTVGPVYQFRHARLQDRLAAVTTEMETTQPSQ